MLSDFINGVIVRRSRNGHMLPEDRLITLIPGMAYGPAGCVLLAFACENKLHWAAIAVGFGLVSFGSVYTPNIAITYIAHRHQGDAAKCLVLVNVFKNMVAFLFLYFAADWVQSHGYLEVYMVMFALGTVTVASAFPLYFFNRKKEVIGAEEN